MSKVILAYSGGLETTAAIHWLKHQRRLRVIALIINVGQNQPLDEHAERALAAGASAAHVFDLRRTFIKNFCWKSLRAGAKYEGRYLLSVALSRPLIATEMVRLAHDEGASFVAHGCPPSGNDQFRVECSIAALDPNLQIVAPVREWPMRTREEVMAYVQRHRIDVDRVAKDSYTHDLNIWGSRASGGDLVDISKSSNEAAYIMTRPIDKTPDTPVDVTIGFTKGEPNRLNGERVDSIDLVDTLNRLGAEHGVGRLDVIEHNLMGFKKREVYEAPGATILHTAHDALERLVMDAEILQLKRYMATVYAETVYKGLWFSNLRESMDAFMQVSQQFVSGDVTVRLHKGHASAESGQSEFSTYDRELATLQGTGGVLPASAAEGSLAIARMLQLNRAFKQRPRL